MFARQSRRERKLLLCGWGAAAALLCLGGSHSAEAQSGSRRPNSGPIYRSQPSYPVQQGSSSRPPAGSGQRTVPGSSTQPGSGTAGTPLGLSGFCPVCIINGKQWVRGSSQFAATYDGKAYYFPDDGMRQMFVASPGQFVPALGGDCTVCLAKMGQRMPGSVYHAAYHQGRLYLFPGEEQKQMFVANPTEYADVDLAMGGMCSVCKVMMGQDVPGDPAFAAYHNGMRYLFPGEEQRKMFLAEPAKFVPAGPGAQPGPFPAGTPTSSLPATDAASPVSQVATDVITVVGRSTCAGCEHGVTPLGSPESLGLGVETPDGTLYVIETAQEQFPQIYRDRFKQLNIEVTGTVLKRDGDVRWLQPTALRVIN